MNQQYIKQLTESVKRDPKYHDVAVAKIRQRIEEQRVKAERALRDLRRAEQGLESFLSQTSHLSGGQERSAPSTQSEIRTIPTTSEITEMVRACYVSKACEAENNLQSECEQYRLYGHR